MPLPAMLHEPEAYIDITASLADMGPEDTVYTSPTGRTIKVKARRQEAGFGFMVVHLSGSECGPDGKALPDGDGHRIGPVRPFTAQADNPSAVASAFDLAKRRTADEIERIATVAALELPGVG